LKPRHKHNPYGGCYSSEEDEEMDIDGGEATRRRLASVSNNILKKGFQEVRPGIDYDDEENDSELSGASAVAEELSECCGKAEQLICEISTHVYNKVQEGSLTKSEVEEVLGGMQEIVNDLESAKCLLKM
jgi:hypothetical protein